jgi:hypothetical protein
MFASHISRWTARLARAAALVKAFALLEDPPRSAAAGAGADRLAGAPLRPASDPSIHVALARAARTHPHRRHLGAAPRARRPGAPRPRPQACVVPIPRAGPATQPPLPARGRALDRH